MNKLVDTTQITPLQRVAIHMLELDILLVNPISEKVKRPLLFLVEDCYTRTILDSKCSFQSFSMIDLEHIIEKNNIKGEVVIDNSSTNSLTETQEEHISEKYNVVIKYVRSHKISLHVP